LIEKNKKEGDKMEKKLNKDDLGELSQI